MCAPLAHCDTDNRHSISYTHNTRALRYLYHYGNEHIYFHDLLVIHELEPLTFLIYARTVTLVPSSL